MRVEATFNPYWRACQLRAMGGGAMNHEQLQRTVTASKHRLDFLVAKGHLNRSGLTKPGLDFWSSCARHDLDKLGGLGSAW